MIHINTITTTTLITILVSLLVTPINGFLFGRRCLGAKERCGFLGLSIKVHRVSTNSDECTESCVFFIDDSSKCGSCGSMGYDISLQLIIPSSDLTLFTAAAERWQSIIVGDLPDRGVFFDGALFSDPRCVAPNTIDDLFICGSYNTIDGPINDTTSSILGFGGPTYTRRKGGLTLIGEMVFDIDDISFLKDSGSFDTVILHEMGHVLGMSIICDMLLPFCINILPSLSEDYTNFTYETYRNRDAMGISWNNRPEK
jgi:hypothetical protein